MPIPPRKRIAREFKHLLADMGVETMVLERWTGVDTKQITQVVRGTGSTGIDILDKLLEPFGMRLEITPYKPIPYRTKKELIEIVKGLRECETIIDLMFLTEYKRKKTFYSRKACIDKYKNYDGAK